MIATNEYRRRAAFASPALLTAAVVIAATRSPEHGAALAALVLGAFAVGPRLDVSAESQHVAAGVALVPAALIALPFAQEEPGSARLAGYFCVAATWMALASASRLLMKRPEWGARSLTLFGAVAVALSGYAHLGAAYAVMAWAFVASCLAASRAEDPDRPPLRRLGRRERLAGAAVLGGAAALAGASAWGLPRLHQWAVENFSTTSTDGATSGFSPWLELGASESTRLSDEVVLRVHGPAPSYLRGIVYNQYERGRWRSTGLQAVDVRTAVGPLQGPDVVRVVRVGGIMGWYFLPLEARDVATRPGVVRADGLGAARGQPGDETRELWYRPGFRNVLRPAPPQPLDLRVPDRLRPLLHSFAFRWTVGAPGPYARMEALKQHLRQEYRYALAFQRTPNTDPVEDFLVRHREGHCEYFASTLALLGRVSGVPTRVVGGYRVAERNPFGGFHVVREKNAHAWVEAWTGTGWFTFDATPAGATPYNEPHEGSLVQGAPQYLAFLWRRTWRWVSESGTRPLVGGGLALLVAWLSWRAWRYRSVGGLRGPAGSVDRALPCMEALADALGGAGLARRADETLERYAERVEGSGLPEKLRAEAAGAIRRYAALRYGAVGEEPEVAREVARVAEAVRSPGAAAAA